MRIGFDGKRATENRTGLGNYSRFILRSLLDCFPKNRYLIYALKKPPEELTLNGAHYHIAGRGIFNSYWRSAGIVKTLLTDKIDLFHGLSNEIPWGLKAAGIPSVVTIHDLIFLRFPHYYPFIDRLIYRIKFRHAALNADRIIAISEQTKRDLIHFFKISEDRIEVIYQNCNPMFSLKASKNERGSVLKKYNLPEKFLLTVGTIEERKNLMLILRALTKLDDLQLVVVGKATAYADQAKSYMKSNGLDKRVHFLTNATYTDLPAMYQQADIFIYPSRFEGFGIPVIEALHSGVPVIAAKGSCLEEAGGPDSVYVDPDDADGLAAAISSILENKNMRHRMMENGRRYVEKFADKVVSGQLINLYQNLKHDA